MNKDVGGKLVLVGAGLSVDLITLRGIEKILEADIVYVDSYTSVVLDDLRSFLASRTGKEAVFLGREDIEERFFETLIKPALEGLKVVLVVPGNPLDATTHVALLSEVSRRKIDFEVVPAPGIIPNALTMSGLMVYKIGKIVTLTYPKSGIISEYPYDVIKDNDLRNLHTPLLTEIDLEKGVKMQVKEAVEILLQLESMRREGVLSESRRAVAVSGLGGKKQRICFGTLKDLMRLPTHEGPHTLVITSPKMHFLEEEVAQIISRKYCQST
ncbi:MAG: diphthine synthase [Desulfurococcaceae archaeon TW002]